MKEGASQTINSSNSTTPRINTVSDSINNMNKSNNNTATNNDDNTLEVIEQLQTMSTADNNVADNSLCANCGKEGANNICNKCQQVKYCNAICKKVHKKKHKKDCEEHIRLAAEKYDEELKLAAELHDIELFKDPPPAEDCPICFIRLPIRKSGSRYMSCCGKVICSGCFHAPLYDNQGNEVDNEKCPFCRTLFPKSNEDNVERLKLRVEAGDPQAMYAVGLYYREGMGGFPQDFTKALDLWHRAGELGDAEAYSIIGGAYELGQGVEVGTKKAKHFYELAAKGGCKVARANLGNMEEEAGNMKRALKHYMIAATAHGDDDSLNSIKRLHTDGHATKEDYMKALKLYQQYLGEIRSRQRDEAAAFDNEQFRYY